MGSNGKAVSIFCNVCSCGQPGRQKLAEVTPAGVEIVSRHHGTYHTGSLSVQELLVQISGTTNGSAILQFVEKSLASGG